MKRKGLRELRRSTRGNTYMAVGIVLDHKKIGCPPCDTRYLQLFRDGKELLFLAITPEEAAILRRLLGKLT